MNRQASNTRFIGFFLNLGAEYGNELAHLKDAASRFQRQDYSTRIDYEVLRRSPFQRVSLEAAIMIPTITDLEGDHRGAVEQFEALLPAIRSTFLAGHLVNNYAVSLLACGSLESALKAAEYACRLGTNPEAFRTRLEVRAAVTAKERARSSVAIHRPGDVLEFRLPAAVNAGRFQIERQKGRERNKILALADPDYRTLPEMTACRRAVEGVLRDAENPPFGRG